MVTGTRKIKEKIGLDISILGKRLAPCFMFATLKMIFSLSLSLSIASSPRCSDKEKPTSLFHSSEAKKFRCTKNFLDIFNRCLIPQNHP